MKQQFKKIIEGERVYLEQVSPKFFPDIVKWRNTARVREFINQPRELTLEMQMNWYNNIYLAKEDECLYIMVDKITNQPFGTTGMTDLNPLERSCVLGHYLIGEEKYLQSVALIEIGMIFNEYCLGALGCEILYCHIVQENKKVINMHIKNGFKENSTPKYSDYTQVGSKNLTEFVFDKNDKSCMQVRNKYNQKIDKVLRLLK